MDLPPVTLRRFWMKVHRRGLDECWPWMAGCQGSGYGQIMVGGKMRLAHRLAYEIEVGPIPEGLQIDHTCHDESCPHPGFDCPHRRCCNPAHLKAVTPGVNVGRSMAPGQVSHRTGVCRSGRHLLAGSNLIVRPNGSQLCRSCKQERERLRS